MNYFKYVLKHDVSVNLILIGNTYNKSFSVYKDLCSEIKKKDFPDIEDDKIEYTYITRSLWFKDFVCVKVGYHEKYKIKPLGWEVFNATDIDLYFK